LSAKIKVSEIRKDYEELDKDKLLDELVDKVLEIEKLKRKLKKYQNPHTPSSKQGFDKPQAQGLKVGRKKGKKSGHKGKTREWETPTMFIDVPAFFNPDTGNTNIQDTGNFVDRLIVDYKIQKTVSSYRLHYYKDINTGTVFLSAHPEVPARGIFGKNIIALANIFHFQHRVTVAGVADIFTNVFDIPMDQSTALDLSNRAADTLEPHYESLGIEIQKSPVVNADETGSNQNGRSEWLWGFFTTTIAFFIFYGRRGGDIVENVLTNFNGILGCDGWKTYKVFSEKYGILLQRCWAHLIREVKYVCKDTEFDKAYTWILDIFEKVKKARLLKRESLRKKKYEKLVQELDQWCQTYAYYRKMRKLVTLIRNGKEHWFTCVLYPQIEPTNNLAERRIRKFVILEKIMGCLRSEQGKRTTQIMLSLIETWKSQGLNPFKQLRATL
jgi:transposase